MTDRDQLRDRLTDIERWTRLLDLHSPRFDGICGGGSKNEAVPSSQGFHPQDDPTNTPTCITTQD